jgi:putative restriction endonuclease
VPGIRFSELVDRFVETIERHGATVIRARATDAARPARIRVVTSEKKTDCVLFLWTITPGGGGPGVRPEGERRIQITNVTQLPMEPGVRTLLGGWSEEAGVFAFWDARRHTRFSQKSPSLQVSLNTLETAGSVGLATQLRPTAEGEEVVVAVAPGSLLWYIENGLQLHNAESDATAVVDLIEATPEEEREFLDSSESEIQSARRYDLVETMRAYRDAKFRPAVLQAYSYRCAICSCDLKLVDAAHIVPVSHPLSTDEVTNGLALCRLHHGAFDNALLGIQSSFRIVINPMTVQRLHEIGLDTGIDQFRLQLPELIRVPASIEARPLPELLRLGMQLRGFPHDLIG